jgi:hypothetical protein
VPFAVSSEPGDSPDEKDRLADLGRDDAEKGSPVLVQLPRARADHERAEGIAARADRGNERGAGLHLIEQPARLCCQGAGQGEGQRPALEHPRQDRRAVEGLSKRASLGLVVAQLGLEGEGPVRLSQEDRPS